MENTEAEIVEMEKELYVAAMRGNIEFLQGRSDEYLLTKTRTQKRNVIHVAIRYEQIDFIKALLLERFPNNYQLISDQESSNKNTSLHIAAEVGNLNIMSVLFDYSKKVGLGEGDKKPWRLKNAKGNTPVHVALVHCNVNVATYLLEKDLDLASITNDLKETPLHVALKQHVNHCNESLMARIQQPIKKGGAAIVIKSAPEENMSNMIEFLVEKASNVASWPDAKGLTPLHRAALLITPYNLKITTLIIEHCPQSAEVCDANGKSILHLLINKTPTYSDARNLLNLREIYALRNHQDQHGNTPLHVAAKNMDINMVRVLLESQTKHNINNSDGLCATSVIQQQNVYQMLRQRKMTNEECEAAYKANISFLRGKLSRLGMNFLLSKDSKGRNVLHKLMQIRNGSHILYDEYIDFIQEVLEIFPTIVCQADQNGDTLVHILARNHLDTKITVATNGSLTVSDGNNNLGVTYELKSLRQSGLLLELLELCNKCKIRIQQEENMNDVDYVSPWLMQNSEGNTPLHEALKAFNNKLVMTLLDYEPKSASLQNKRMETPLHLLARNPPHIEPFSREDIEMMVNASHEATFLPDKDCLTPLLIAFKNSNLSTATILCTISPEAAKIADADGQTFLHLLVQHPSDYFVFLLVKNSGLRHLLRLKDKDGNTLLHLAIKGNRFDIVQIFLDTWEGERRAEQRMPGDKNKWLVQLFEIPNKAGKTPSDLIAESLSLPPGIAKSIGDKYEMIGVRSMWGIPTIQMKTYVNTMGIIAALLTTITFTTAFTVPGGLMENEGTPVLIGQAAFQIFMISDVLAMCLSMMVLFCLLWIMATSNRHNSVMLLDLSVALLLASFYATLMTFMTGLFATMYPVKPWIAIVTLILCSSFTLLVHKLLVVKLLIPFSHQAMENAKALEMDKELYVATIEGNVKVLEEIEIDEYLLRKTHEKNNILHIAIRRQNVEFIEAILRRFPNNKELICEKNSKENTPLHIAVEVGNIDVVKRVYDHLEKMTGEDEEGDENKPWKMKNKEGNTPVHEAIVHGNVEIAMFLLDKDPSLAGIVNESKEAPLHLAIKQHSNYCKLFNFTFMFMLFFD
ncbi:Ankyrin-2 [Bienertia sinuspersici]